SVKLGRGGHRSGSSDHPATTDERTYANIGHGGPGRRGGDPGVHMMRASKQRAMSIEGLESRQLLSVRPTLPVAAEIHSQKALPQISGVPVQGNISGKVNLIGSNLPVTGKGIVGPLGNVTVTGNVRIKGGAGVGNLTLKNAQGSLTLSLQ